MQSLFVGISAVFSDDHTAVVAIAVRDTVYLHDFTIKHLELNGAPANGQDIITDYVVDELSAYEHKNFVKFVGAGLPHNLMKMAPTLSSRLWAELDIVAISIKSSQEDENDSQDMSYWDVKCVDEQADSMARKCIM